MKVTLEELAIAVKTAENIEDLKLLELDSSRKYVMFVPTLSQNTIESLSQAFYRLKVGVLVISNDAIYNSVKVFEIERQE